MPDIYSILENDDFGKVVDELCVDVIEGREVREYLDEYKGKRTRRSTSVGRRENKTKAVYSETLKDKEGNPLKLEDKTVPVARIVTNFPKKLVRTSVAFMFGGKMVVSAEDPNDGYEHFKEVWERKLKMHSVIKQFARTVLSETKSAIVFYPAVSIKWNGEKIPVLKAKVLKQPIQSDIDYDFYMHVDDQDDMDGFIHKFQVRIEGVVRDRVLIWTREKMIAGTKIDSDWEVLEADHPFGLIPVVYGDIFEPEWEEVAPLMDAREMRLSRTADTNDYFAEPILKTIGETNLPSKETTGKELQFPVEFDEETGKPIHGDAEFLAWQQSIDSVKKELEELKNEMDGGSSTPDLSFNNLIGIGNLSGVARRFMTLDAQIKASENMETFGPAVQRCVSVVSAGIANITNIKYRDQLANNWITVNFESILPKDPVEDAQVLSIAGGGKPFNSRRTIVEKSPLTPSGDVDDELARMDEDEAREAKKDNSIGLNFGEE